MRSGGNRFLAHANHFTLPEMTALDRDEDLLNSRLRQTRIETLLDRLREAPAGYLFDVMTNGFGVMPGYAAQVPVEDRWAIAAYVRTLQLSQHFNVADQYSLGNSLTSFGSC